MKKIGVALGEGSARGFAHIGVLKTFEKYDVPIDYLAGSSVGALIAAFYASGINANDLEKLALTTNVKKLLDFTFPKEGVLKGDSIELLIRRLLQNKNFEDLKIPLAIVTVDLKTGNKIVIKEGDLAKAIRASISVSGVFVPVRMKKMILVDGGIIDPVPVSVVKEMGAEVVVGIQLGSYEMDIKKRKKNMKKFEDVFNETFLRKEAKEIEIHFKRKHKKLAPFLQLASGLIDVRNFTGFNIFKFINKSYSITMNELANKNLKEEYVNFVIKPNVYHIGPLDFEKVKDAIKEGEKAAEDVIKKIDLSAIS